MCSTASLAEVDRRYGARTLFDHLLDLHALEEPQNRSRFLAHSIVGTDLVASWDPLQLFLSGKALKAARHRQKVLRRDNRRQLEEAIAEYGAGFRRQRHPWNAWERAVACGLEDEYDFFRASSTAVHGGPTAMEGSVWFEDGEPILRFGPSVMACPASLAAGLHLMRLFLAETEAQLGTRTDHLALAIEAMGQALVDFCRYTNGVEQFLFEEDGLERPTRSPQVLLLDDE